MSDKGDLDTPERREMQKRRAALRTKLLAGTLTDAERTELHGIAQKLQDGLDAAFPVGDDNDRYVKGFREVTVSTEGPLFPPGGGVYSPPPKRYRCKKGHVTEGRLTFDFAEPDGSGRPLAARTRSVPYCPHCYLDLIERECGGLEEVARP